MITYHFSDKTMIKNFRYDPIFSALVFPKIEGAKVFLVGGAVRDLVLGRIPKDYDYVIVGATHEMMVDAGYKKVGYDFPVYLSPTGEECALARIERKTGMGYLGFECDSNPGVTLEDDLKRRDLTINSMAIDEDGDLIDPHGGANDLEARLMRHTSEAFAEDPVRILRIARFAARYSFDIADNTKHLIRSMIEIGAIEELVPERVWSEMERGMMEADPERMYQVLDDVGAFSSPSLSTFRGGVNQGYFLYNFLRNNPTIEVPLRVRFTILAAWFHGSKQLFQAHCIPNELSQLSTMWTLNERGVKLYLTDSTAEQRLETLRNIGAIGSRRHGTWFKDILFLLDIEADWFRHKSPTTPWIREYSDCTQAMLSDAKRLNEIDYEELVNSIPPKQIGAYILDYQTRFLGALYE